MKIMIDSSAYKINVILIIMLKTKVWCDVSELPVSSIEISSNQGFTEYFIEHNVSEKDAAKSFRLQADRLLKKNLSPLCARKCNATTQQYCLGNAMLHDHCCCDARHGKEEFPWLPHTCYVGERCKAIIGSCYLYAEIRECCCVRAIAKQWEPLLSSSTVLAGQLSHTLVILFVNLLFLVQLRNRLIL